MLTVQGAAAPGAADPLDRPPEQVERLAGRREQCLTGTSEPNCAARAPERDGPPIWSSSERIWALTAAGVTFSSSAALVKLR